MLTVVLRAANLLQVDEYEVFRLAHRFWHHHCAESSATRRAFKNYLQHKTAPPWVVHFSRRVVQAYRHGDFDPAKFGVYPAYEKLPLSWALVLRTPRFIPLKQGCEVFAA